MAKAVSHTSEANESDSPTPPDSSGQEALVLRAKEGDPDAFGDLVRIYQRRAVSVAYRLLNRSDDAADVAQDAFVRAYRSLDQLEDPARFGAWLLRTVCNLALNYRRARASKMAASLDGAFEPERDRRRPTAADERGGLSEELREAVAAAVRQLPDKQRLALILFSVEGMPQKEVAAILDCTIALVKWNVFQARKKLKVLLEEHL